MLKCPEGDRTKMNKAQRCHGYNTACAGIVIGLDQEWTYQDAASILNLIVLQFLQLQHDTSRLPSI